MKTVLFVPGYGEDMTSRDYAGTIKAIKDKGYDVVLVPINWVRTTIYDWTAELDAIYESYDAKETILAGFSFGAVTAFLSAIRRNPAELWLFSLSPYFYEDIHSPTMKQIWLKEIGHRRVTAFETLYFERLLPSIHSKVIFFYGDLELPTWPDITYRTPVMKQSRNSTLKMAKGAGHDVSHPNYIHAIEEVI